MFKSVKEEHKEALDIFTKAKAKLVSVIARAKKEINEKEKKVRKLDTEAKELNAIATSADRQVKNINIILGGK